MGVLPMAFFYGCRKKNLSVFVDTSFINLYYGLRDKSGKEV